MRKGLLAKKCFNVRQYELLSKNNSIINLKMENLELQIHKENSSPSWRVMSSSLREVMSLQEVGGGERGAASVSERERGSRGLASGQAAHLAVFGAGLVHEGAVQAGPHGGGGDRRRGTTHRSVTMGTGRLASHCAAELLDCCPLL